MYIIALTLFVLICIHGYKRYVPVKGVPSLSNLTFDKDRSVLDTRDYQTVYKDPVEHSIHIPYAYLKRFYKKIPNKKVFILVSDSVEKNLVIRFLRKNGFEILGYKIYTRGEINHGVQQRDFTSCQNY